MKKKIIIAILIVGSIITCRASTDFVFNIDNLFESNGKYGDVTNSFNKEYIITYSISDSDKELKEEIETLAKKTTYLLFGEFNNNSESSESYYKRKQDFYNLRYKPDIPKDEDGKEDTNSQEYTDRYLSSWALNGIFKQAFELGLIYNSFGNIRITTVNDKFVICTMSLPNVTIKEQNKDNPMEYTRISTNYVMNYYYKKWNNEWQLYYLYGEDTNDLSQYIDDVEDSKSKSMSIAPSYESDLSNVYNFDKVKELTTNDLNEINETNSKYLVTLKSFYNNYVIESANGFFINDNLIVTTWNFLEKSLVKAQWIIANSNDEVLEIDGIVTINLENDIAVLKVKNNKAGVQLGDFDKTNVEDPVIVINNEAGVGSTIQTGIIVSNKDYIQTSIPISYSGSGSPLFNKNGEVIGMLSSKSINSSLSIAINSIPLKEIQDKFSSINYDEIKAISFDELKEKYYYVSHNEEKIKNDIPEDKWNTYSKIGDIKNTIRLELIKANYVDGIVSLRYKNSLSGFITAMNAAASFREQLLKDGYKETSSSDTKCIYSNNQYQVVIMDEFDYLIVVMVKL